MASNKRVASWSGSLVSEVPVAGECGFIADGAPPVKAWRYWLPNVDGEGWALAMLDENGSFFCLSDFGDYAYGRWSFGKRDFRMFFVEIGPDYLAHKLAGGRKEYDAEATLAAVKLAIIKERREGALTKEEARDEWDLVVCVLNELSHEGEFLRWYDQTQIADATDCYRSKLPGDIVNFCKKVLPGLQAVIREQLAAEKAMK